jgi:hypothetical protein
MPTRLPFVDLLWIAFSCYIVVVVLNTAIASSLLPFCCYIVDVVVNTAIASSLLLR